MTDAQLSSFGDFRLGDWVVQPRLNRISCDDSTVTLEPKVMQVLVCLAKHAGDLVTRQELIDTVWATEFIGEKVLTRAIVELRRAFGDDAKNPRVIETIHRGGYVLLVKPGQVSDEESSVRRTLSHYLLLEHLGGGGMGVVYRAEDTKLGREVALKFLPKELRKDPDARERFIREARAASALDHPHICTIHEIDETPDGQLFIVMAFYDGETLKKKIERGPLPVEEAVRICGEVAEGLQRAHEAGIIHRDIKPANVMVTSDGVAKVVDFGLAKLIHPLPGSTTALETSPGMLIGTVAYMAPEQVRGEPADYRSDIFALGCVLYEMLTGERPFRGVTTTETAAAILKEEPRPFTEYGMQVAPEVANAVESCLEKDPERRFQSAGDLAFALGSESEVALSSVVPSEPSRTRTWAMPSLAIAGILVVALAMVLGPGILERFGGRPEQPPIRSIAILPLENLTGDPEQAYFVDGLHEELNATFAQISGFDKVIARTSVMGFRDSDSPIREIGKQLDVDAVLEGSVRWSGNTIRVTLQLFETDTEHNIWAKSFDRDLTDILALQSEVAQTVADTVSLSLSQNEETRLAQTGRVDHEAYEAYLMGNHLRTRAFLEEDFMKAIGFYQLAIEKDPDIARAYVGLARGYLSLSDYRPPAEVMPLALEAVQKAVELDETDGEAYAILGRIKEKWLWDWSGAEAAHRKALELKPNSIWARYYYSIFLVGMLRYEEAVANQRRAVELAPLQRVVGLGWIYWATGRYEKAEAYLSKHIDRYPDAVWARQILSWTYSFMGRTSDGVIIAEEARDLHPAPFDDPYLVMTLVNAYGYAGENEKAHAALQRLLELRRTVYIPAPILAFAYSAINDFEGAIEWYGKTFEEHHGHATMLRTWVEFKPQIAADPRIQALIQSMNFPEN